MGVPSRLTGKQIIFIQELVYNEGEITATEAAIKAGYPEASARSKASMLQNPKYYPLVAERIKQEREDLQKKYQITSGKHFKKLQEIRDVALAAGSYSAAVNAEIARGKAGGLYIDQKIIKHGKLDQLTDQEVDEKIADLMREMKIIDVQAEEVTVPKDKKKIN